MGEKKKQKQNHTKCSQKSSSYIHNFVLSILHVKKQNKGKNQTKTNKNKKNT